MVKFLDLTRGFLMQTIGGVLDKSGGVGQGFDFLRIALATSVICWHSWSVLHGDGDPDYWPIIWLPGFAVLVMFFGLSGFLITGSALRLGLKDFIINRSLRIVPALSVDVIVWAFILGPWFSNVRAQLYYSNELTYRYLTNIVGFVNYSLPGVFYINPDRAVNVSLWTVPFEIGCYIIMSALIFFGFLKKRIIVSCVAIGFIVAGLLIWTTIKFQ